MSGYVRCACCNQPIAVTDDDVGLTVTCPRTRRLVPVKAADIRTGGPSPAPKPPAPPIPVPAPVPLPAPSPGRPARPRKTLLVAGAAGLLAIGCVVGVLVGRGVFQRGEGERPDTTASRGSDSPSPSPSAPLPPSGSAPPGPLAAGRGAPPVGDRRPGVPPALDPGVPAAAPVPPVIAPAPVTRADCIRLLAKDLKDPLPEKRIKALEQLATYGAEANIVGADLIEAMRDANPTIRDTASETFEKVNPKLHPHVFTIIRGMNKYTAVLELSQMGSDATMAVPLLYHWIDHPGDYGDRFGGRRRRLLDAIAAIDPGDARLSMTVLTAISRRVAPNSEGQNDRQWALEHLSRVSATKADKVKALVAALDDGVLILAVIEALGRYGRDAAPALPALKKLKLSADDFIRMAAIEAIKRIE